MTLDFSGRAYQRTTASLLFLVAACWLFVHLGIGRSPGTDEVFFKCAGLSWARGGPWAAVEESGFLPPSVKPGLDEVFFTYPPAYPFGFGLMVKGFGFNWRTCIAYDAMIHLGLMAALGWFFSVASQFTARHRWLLLTGLIFAGTPSRPDELAMCFGYLGLTLALRPDTVPLSQPVLWLSNLLLALCGITSVPCIMVIGAIRASWIFFSSLSWRRKVLEGATLAFTVAIVWAAAAAWVMSWHPGALQQNLSASLTNVSGEATIGFAHLFAYHREAFVVGVILGLASLIQLALIRSFSGLVAWCQWWPAPLLVWAFFFSRYRFQGGYYWFWTPWMLAAAIVLIRSIDFSRRPGPEFAGLLASMALLMILGIQNVRHLLINAMLPDSQRWAAESPLVNALIPSGARVLTWAHWWTIGDRCRVTDNFVAEYADPADIDYIIMTSHGSGTPGTHHALPPKFQDAIAQGRYKIIRNTIDTSRPHLASLPLSNSAWGSGCIIYAATTSLAQSQAPIPLPPVASSPAIR